MEWNFTFFLNSILLGLGLSMDAFSVSLANGLNYPEMKIRKMLLVAGIFAFFQAAMPLLGWVCVHTAVGYFSVAEKIVPYVSLVLLSFIGGKMIYDGIKKKESDKKLSVKFTSLLVQGIATSIDALSVGFTIAEYGWQHALVCALIIAAVTFSVCFPGVIIGKKAGTKYASKAAISGGIILIVIGLEIFITEIIS